MSLIGETIGNYQILRFLGNGNMAEVYLAAHITEKYPVAIKVVHSHLMKDANFLERFRREARVLSELDHPHIIHVYESVVELDQAYIVMEYLSGGTLAEKLKTYSDRKESLPIENVLQILEPIASAVDYAHEYGLVHRDLKPANILFRGNDDPVLTDFGLAFLMNDPRLSASNTITGTPAYLSPEQAKGMPGDARSDVYALGIVLYEMLSGYTPFQGNVISIVMKHISEAPPSIRSFGRYLPKKVESVVFKALEKQPHMRYQSAQFFARDLHNAIEKTMPDVLKNKIAAPEEIEWDSGKAGGESESTSSAEQMMPPVMESGSAAQLPDASLQTITNEPRENIESSGETGEKSTVTDANKSQPALEARRANPRTPEAAMPSLPKTRRKEAPVKRSGTLLTIGVVAVIIFLIFLASQAIGGITPTESTGQAGPSKYNNGQRLTISVPGGASTSVYKGCRSVLSGGVVGMVTNNQSAVIKSRRECGKEWFYEVVVKDAATKDWDGNGFIPEKYLR